LKGFSQKEIYKGYFNVIISLSAINTDNNAEQIKSLLASDTAKLTYEGYCKSQKCIILKANLLYFNSAQAVVGFLKKSFGNSILCNKEYAVKDFYKLCTFSSEQEYQYFKTTYR
jgi:hypothetical protein